MSAATAAVPRAAGINRLSLGMQSFNDRHLRALGRIHGSREAIRAAEQARAAGFVPVTLGARVLRAETAALAALVLATA
mgnify:CR=1 FL=1